MLRLTPSRRLPLDGPMSQRVDTRVHKVCSFKNQLAVQVDAIPLFDPCYCVALLTVSKHGLAILADLSPGRSLSAASQQCNVSSETQHVVEFAKSVGISRKDTLLTIFCVLKLIAVQASFAWMRTVRTPLKVSLLPH